MKLTPCLLCLALTIGCDRAGSTIDIDRPDDLPSAVEWQNASSTSFHAIYFVSPSEGWAVGSGGAIVRTGDGGQTWQDQTSGVTAHLNALHFVDGSRGWAVGDNGVVISTADGGRTWRPQDSGVPFPLLSVHFATSEIGWAVAGANSGLIVATHDGGRTWTEQYRNTSHFYNSVFFVDEENGWAVGGVVEDGGTTGVIVATTNGGHTWTTQERNSKGALSSVSFVTKDTGWAVGMAGSMLATSDGGRRWRPQETNPTLALQRVQFVNEQVGWVTGEGVLLQTTDGGRSWTTGRGPFPASTLFPWFYFVDEERGYAIGMGQDTILATRDGGATWVPKRGDVPVLHLYSVNFLDRERGWAAGGSGVIMSTRNGGKTWVYHRSGTLIDLGDIQFVDDSHGWAVGLDGTIIATIDAGKTWTTQESGVTNHLIRLCFVDAATGWVVGHDGAILSTVDGGSTWERQQSKVSSDLLGVHFLDRRRGWVVGNELGGRSGGVILMTEDGGETWIEQMSNLRAYLNDVHFINPNEGWAVGGNTVGGLMFVTRDGGRNWARTPRTWPGGLTDISFSGAKTGWVTGSDDSTRTIVLATWDGGITWSPRPIPLGSYPRISFVDESHGWLVSNTPGAILETDDSGKTWRTLHGAAIDSYESVHFFDESRGWIVGSDGLIRATKDGGRTWIEQESGVTAMLNSVYFVTESQGWIAGGDASAQSTTAGGIILSTSDGGDSWVRSDLGVQATLNAIHFAGDTRGWAVGDLGTILSTTDSGQTWERQDSGLASALLDVHFVDSRTGWVVGGDLDGALILSTEDAGHTWKPYPIETGPVFLNSVYFLDAMTGYAVGGDLQSSTILHTIDGGRSWQPQPVNVMAILNGVHFVSRTTGWVVGVGGCYLNTTDGGQTWKRQRTEQYNNLRDVHFVGAGTSLVGWAVGWEKTCTSGRHVSDAPYVAAFSAAESPRATTLTWACQDESLDRVTCIGLEFRHAGVENADWRRLDTEIHSAGDGSFETKWNPGDARYGVREGTSIVYRVSVVDETGTQYDHEIPREYVYRPWWNRQPAFVRGGVIVASFIGGYVLVGLALLWTCPAALVWIHHRIPVNDLAISLAPNKALQWLLRTLLTLSGVSALLRHRRTRNAWVSRYRAGKASFSGLDRFIREEFLNHADCLDAWVERRTQDATDALNRTPTVRDRRICIGLPLRVGQPAEGRRISEPTPEHLQFLFERCPAVVALVGSGGTGKSTFACQLARWALAREPKDRLAEHRMIPIFVEEETDNLFELVVRKLRQIVGNAETDDDIVGSLLRHQRLLVVVDALSERTIETQRHVETVHGRWPMNALVLTTRHPPNLGPTPITHLWPERIEAETLFYFLTEYLRRIDAHGLFAGRGSLQVGDRLMSLVEQGGENLTVTPLLIRIFVDNAIALRRLNLPIEDLPISVSETFLEYLRRVNPQDPKTPNRVSNDLMIRGARVLGACSLSQDYVPRDFYRDDAERDLEENGCQSAGTDVVGRLVDNGILDERDRGGTSLLRFRLDTLAEYLMALACIDRMRDDQGAWTRWHDELQSIEGYPESIRGFLVAMEDCIETYRHDFRIPELPVASKRPLDPQ